MSQPRANGFTLTEMLVALAILSLAALALVRLDAFTLRSTVDLDANAMARIVAGNAATDLLTDVAAPVIGSGSERVSNGGRGWLIERRVASIGDAGVRRIDLRVTGDGGGRAALTLVRPGG